MIHIPKSIRKTIITVVVLIVCFAASGVAYVFFTDQNTKPEPKSVIAKNTATSSIPQPVQPGPNNAEGAAIEYVSSPVNVGSNASASVLTNAESICTISVSYNGVQSTDSGLISKAADAYGSVIWTWTVGNSVPVGNWPIKVTCIYHGRSAVVTSSFQVIK